MIAQQIYLNLLVPLIQDPPQGEGPQGIANPAKPAAIDYFGQLEKLASTFDHVDGLFYFTYAVCIFFFFLIAGVLAYSVVKYRRKTWDQPAASHTTHNTPLEVVWTVVPLIIVMIMFAWGWKGSLDMTVVPADARQHKAIARQWNWEFQYPNDPISSYGELWLEVDKPAAFTLQSMDVLHAFFMPAMRCKRDIVPGRQQTVWFHPTEIGEYHLFCAEYCGLDHSKMYAKVHVISAADYAKEPKPWNTFDDSTPAAAIESGGKLYRSLCSSCHTITGADSTGPTWKGIFTKQGDQYVGRSHDVLLPDNTRQKITVDFDYIKESILNPTAKRVAEPKFATATMTPFVLQDNRIRAIVAYMQSLADQP